MMHPVVFPWSMIVAMTLSALFVIAVALVVVVMHEQAPGTPAPAARSGSDGRLVRTR